MKPLFFVAFIVVFTLIGDYLLKLASLKPQSLASVEFLAGTALYALSAVGWVYAMKHLTLGAIGVFYSILVIVLLAAMGVLLFGERLSAREIAGLGLACASLVLMSRFH